MKYLLSIVIPTRNNKNYLLQTVRQMLSNTSNDVQIVIQDNSDNNDDALVEVLNSSRVKYNYDAHRLSMIDNFSKALTLVDGKYVVMIGDDDGVLPHITDFIKYADENNIEVLVPSITYEYFWPNSVVINNSDTGVVRFLDCKYSLRKTDGVAEVVKLLKNGCQDYTVFKTGKLYHGIVKKDLLDIIYSKQNSYFGGLVPDIYMAVATSLVSQSIYHLSIPLTIAGVCPSSGSSQSSNGLHIGDYNEAPQLQGRTSEYSWSPLVPKFYSVETIWADSALAAIRDMGRDDLIKYFSIEKIIGRLLFKYKRFKSPIHVCYSKNTLNNNVMKRAKSKLIITIYPLVWFLERVIRRLKRINKQLVYYYDIKDISIACDVYKNRVGPSILEKIRKNDT